jgi:hypothetical protein
MLQRAALPLLLPALLLAACTCGRHGASRPREHPAVVLVDPDEASRPDPVAEREPNDRRASAGALTLERPVEGQIQQPKDQDWYRVRVEQQGQILRATLSGVVGLDLVLEAFDEDGKRQMRVNNAKDGGGEVLVNLAARQPSYFLRVTERHGRTGPGKYRLDHSLRPAEPGEELEPNWKAALATDLALEQDAVGYLGWFTDDDWYRVTPGQLDPASRLRVEYDGLDHVRANLSLRDGSGRIVQDRWSRPGEGVVLSNLGLPGGQGLLHVVLRTQYQANVESRYYLRVLVDVPAGPTEVEPNDTPQAATPLSSTTPLAGILGDTLDRDLYRIAADRPALVRIRATPPLGLDLSLATLDAEGKVAWEVDSGGPRKEEVIPALQVQPPGVLVQVRAPKRGAVTSVSSYRITARALDLRPTEVEPNDRQDQATSWPADQPQMDGYAYPKDDVDQFSLLPQVDRLRIRVKVPAGLKLRLELLAADRSRLAATTVSGAGGELAAGVEPGTEYWLKVTALEGGSAANSAYLLTRGE